MDILPTQRRTRQSDNTYSMESQIRKRGTILGSQKKAYTIAYRHEVITYYKDHEHASMADTAKHFKIPLNTFKSFWKCKEKILGSNREDKRSKTRSAHHEQLEVNLIKFLQLARENRYPVTGEVIRTKAVMLRDENGIPEHVFKASKGWLQNFLRRHGVQSTKLHGEAGAVDVTSVQEAMITFCHVLAKYEPQHIYNEDESGLVYQMLPNVTYLAPEEVKREARGVKAMKAKNRVTFTMCTNGDGSHVLDCMLIGKAKRPHAFDLAEEQDKVDKLYRAQRNSWMNGDLFTDYIEKLWYPSVRKHTSANVCMIVDNCSAHGNGLPKLPGVEYAFLPPNVTSHYQPMDQGLIAAVKRHARSQLLKQVLEVMPRREELRAIGKRQRAGTAGLKYGYSAHVLDAMRMVQHGVAQLTQKAIVYCWIRAGILSKDHIKKALSTIDEEPTVYKRTPGILAEELRSRAGQHPVQNILESVANLPFEMPVEARRNDGVDDLSAFNDILQSMDGRDIDGAKMDVEEMEEAVKEWIAELAREEERPAETVLRDPVAIVRAVEEIQTQKDVQEKEELEERQRVVRENMAQRELEKVGKTYRELCANMEWLRGCVDEAKERGLSLEIQARLVDALRLMSHERSAAAPQSRQTTVVDFFKRKDPVV